MADESLSSWRAIEALRAGVPSRDAVRFLGSSQAEAERRFSALLDSARETDNDDQPQEGLLLSGEFGSGKSHLLEHLQHLALEQRFACSRVVISKETPLADPARIFAAAVDGLTLPDRRGQGLADVAFKLDPKSEAYGRFYSWLNDEKANEGLSQWFAASVYVFQNSGGDRASEIAESIIRFWSGGPLKLTELRGWLRELGQIAAFALKRESQKLLTSGRFRFCSQLIRSAGYKGWILFVDEAELIGQYSLLQRGKSYAQLARLLGHTQGASYPGLATVATITSNFGSDVIVSKFDEDKVPERILRKDDAESQALATDARMGMRLIPKCLELSRPTEKDLKRIHGRVALLYLQAYGGDGPAIERKYDITLPVRTHIKRWINEWDLVRLYPGFSPQTEVRPLGPDFSENPDLEPHEESEAGEEGA